MEERAQLGKGLVVTNLISLTILLISTFLSNLVAGLVLFAVSLPVSAFFSSKLIKKVED